MDRVWQLFFIIKSLSFLTITQIFTNHIGERKKLTSHLLPVALFNVIVFYLFQDCNKQNSTVLESSFRGIEN